MSEENYVYAFDEVKCANTQEWVFRLGNKGAQLAEMTENGLPVPPGFTITTKACNTYYELGEVWPQGLEEEIRTQLKQLEEKLGKQLGAGDNPMFVSVRSGSYVSMPGMMDTVLNLGMNDVSVESFAQKTNNPRAAYDSYRRFITMFGDVVMNVKHALFEKILDETKEAKGAKLDTDLTADDLKELVPKYKALVREEAGKDFPQDAFEQLKLGIGAVFSSWNTPRAVSYRRINHLKNDAGTGVNVQAMVFGNMGDASGTGVSFTRNPSTGEKEHYGEFLINAQGEDVVAGIRTPKQIDEMEGILPDVYSELVEVYDTLENHYKDLQDFEFTFENKTLYLLQTRKGKRTGKAAVKIAVDMVSEGLITKEEAVLRVDPNALDQLLHKQFDPDAEYTALTKALPASPGAAVGKVVFTAEDAKLQEEEGEKVILVRVETSPEDIEGMHSAQGILTARGGMTSHAAVVARGMGKCCVAGAEEITVNEKEKKFMVGEVSVKEGDIISLNGTTGEVIIGEVGVVDPQMDDDFETLMAWADEFRTMKVRTNADTPKDAILAREFGAEGIGLVRTEHMFFDTERIKAVREMILAKDVVGRQTALAKIEPFQVSDFEGIFEAMDGFPVIIRMLDPPLHEFLPKEDKHIEELAKDLGVDASKIKETIESLHEFNPMLGFRGCRLALVYPEIMEMQVRAILVAAKNVRAKGMTVIPEIEVPLVGNVKEFNILKELVHKVAGEVGAEEGSYKIGTMFEVPRAALTADEFASVADFISFGTNDLTQMTCGFSRDDAGKFLGAYVEKGIYLRDPFQAIDQEGVGKLMEAAVVKARGIKADIDIGICGEHGGEPSSVEFCHRIGLSNVSCSPFRVPIARLAAAQAALKEKQN
ncbi:MAG: pyruvate, phosphate dikinase [Candidatus Diapherotrites archaeon]|nr:pyruvate, phosphate dikinase [Candidatus Diapherotrites archaeon]MBT4596395.1 pyruvate, phosphate dikinase [Candidatus Diapherotrites archaeon]